MHIWNLKKSRITTKGCGWNNSPGGKRCQRRIPANLCFTANNRFCQILKQVFGPFGDLKQPPGGRRSLSNTAWYATPESTATCYETVHRTVSPKSEIWSPQGFDSRLQKKARQAMIRLPCLLGSVDKKDTRIKNKNFGLAWVCFHFYIAIRVSRFGISNFILCSHAFIWSNHCLSVKALNRCPLLFL